MRCKRSNIIERSSCCSTTSRNNKIFWFAFDEKKLNALFECNSAHLASATLAQKTIIMIARRHGVDLRNQLVGPLLLRTLAFWNELAGRSGRHYVMNCHRRNFPSFLLSLSLSLPSSFNHRNFPALVQLKFSMEYKPWTSLPGSKSKIQLSAV